jgi:hypothetical protein
MIREESSANRPTQWFSALGKRHTIAEAAIEFVTGLCAALVAAPTCMACGNKAAQAGWVIDALGGIHGLCTDCADLKAGLPGSNVELEDAGGLVNVGRSHPTTEPHNIGCKAK